MIQKHASDKQGESAADTPDPGSCTFSFDDRHWRVRGLERNTSPDRLRVNLLVSRGELVHVDSLDLYVARHRASFIKQAAAELYVQETTVKNDLGRVLLALEARQAQVLAAGQALQQPPVPPMTDQQREEAMRLLKDPRLVRRILDDYEACGLVGERVNKLVCYLACVSRLLPRPLSVLIQSSSAAGKTSLLEATLALMPAESLVRMSALTGQSLYYMGQGQLQHKILAVAEEEGVAQAAYALKLLQSEGALRIACVGRDAHTGRQQTETHEVEGPVSMLLTTTAEHPDPELANRCVTLSVCERARQTQAIHRRQRVAYRVPDKERAERTERESIAQRHQRAQRLLEPLRVVMPFAERLTFRTDQLRYRRDHAKYLALIAAVTLLHQHQRERITRGGRACVVATFEDLRWANRLAVATFGRPVDELLPQARQLLTELDRLVTERAGQANVARQQVRFTQRELRETLGWSDRSLRRQLSRLGELEYVLTYRTGRGNQREYQLLYDPHTRLRSGWQLGLVDVDQLRRETCSARPARQAHAIPLAE